MHAKGEDASGTQLSELAGIIDTYRAIELAAHPRSDATRIGLLDTIACRLELPEVSWHSIRRAGPVH
jgi:hypothetical protein